MCGKPTTKRICTKCINDMYEPVRSSNNIYHCTHYYKSSKMIKMYKYASHPSFSKIMGEMLCKLFIDLKIPEEVYTVTFIPSNKKSYYEKGFIPAKEIAKHFAKYFDFELKELLINKSKKRHAEMTQNERLNSVNFEIIKKVPKNIIIIDDVYTSGASMNTAIELLNTNTIGLTFAKTR
ncbi:amidophosphoribosyltransferase [Tepiditoga spiralis]|uniref:Amidophosphoribosyltransferase n=1 Tax=Tepiditoga spiralis TaxID=2108365 RepID=A0A7G1G4E6_9BACT|nr:phosphoribosyltransferase family protein [Tepiditoga spiralis]BBE30086.1 amidophosphoribosyltransferase [Tepiditoga spiralis]